MREPPPVWLHAPDGLTRDLFPAAKMVTNENPDGVVVARRLDERLLNLLKAGGRVLLLPDGEPKSFPLTAHWFLRGGPYLPAHPLLVKVPRELLIETQQFDLAGDVIPDIPYLEQIDPVFMLWDTHDGSRVKTHGLVFETRLGKGRLLVSALRHGGAENAVGRWLLDLFVRHLASGLPPKNGLTDACLKHLETKLRERQLDLTDRAWHFRPDSKNRGQEEGWQRPDLAYDASWKEIHVGKSWTRQGYADLVGWAWYRLDVDVPGDWKGEEIYLVFDGVLDYYEVYVNGNCVGRGGELRPRQEVEEVHRSYRITPHVRPGETCHLAIRVGNAEGSGGIWRPVRLTTAPVVPEIELLR